MPAIYVKPYAKRGKSDAIDAEAICEPVHPDEQRRIGMVEGSIRDWHSQSEPRGGWRRSRDGRRWKNY